MAPGFLPEASSHSEKYRSKRATGTATPFTRAASGSSAAAAAAIATRRQQVLRKAGPPWSLHSDPPAHGAAGALRQIDRHHVRAPRADPATRTVGERRSQPRVEVVQLLQIFHQGFPGEVPAGPPQRLGEDGAGGASEDPGGGVTLPGARTRPGSGKHLASLRGWPRRIGEQDLSVEEPGCRGRGPGRERPRREDEGRPPQPRRLGSERRELAALAEEDDRIRLPRAHPRHQRGLNLAPRVLAPPRAPAAPRAQALDDRSRHVGIPILRGMNDGDAPGGKLLRRPMRQRERRFAQPPTSWKVKRAPASARSVKGAKGPTSGTPAFSASDERSCSAPGARPETRAKAGSRASSCRASSSGRAPASPGGKTASSSLRPWIPPRALISSSCSCKASRMARPTSAGGPSNGSTVATRIREADTPSSCSCSRI